MSIQDLKKNSKNNMEDLQKKIEKMNKPQSQNKDDRFWRHSVDSSGNGFAVIRFLDTPDGESCPWVQLWEHGFKGPNGWYIEKSLTTIGKKDPCTELNSSLWNSGIESNKEIAKRQKRSLKYISNILVIKDPVHPENEGKVFLFKYGKKIFDKINELLYPDEIAGDDTQPINPFDFWKGCNFKLKIKTVDKYPNYDNSKFDTQSALFDDDAKIEEVYKNEYKLFEFVNPESFKTYDQLKERLDTVLGLNDSSAHEKEKPAKEKVVEKTTPAVEDSYDNELDNAEFEALAKLVED